MEKFVNCFKEYLRGKSIFPDKEIRYFFMEERKRRDYYFFVIAAMNQEQYEMYETNKERYKRNTSLNELLWLSEIYIEMDFTQKQILEVTKDRYLLENKVERLFRSFLQKLPENSEEMKMYEEVRKKHRLKWLFEV